LNNRVNILIANKHYGLVKTGLNVQWVLDSGAQSGDGQKERCGERKLRTKEDYILSSSPLFVLLSGFLNLSQSKSSRRKAGQYNVAADGKTGRRKRGKKDKSQPERKQKRVGVKWDRGK
jgi:hypothetical protein